MNRLVPDHELLDSALAWARKLSGQAPLAVRAIKRVSGAGDLDAGIEAEKRAFGEVFASEDATEGVSVVRPEAPPRASSVAETWDWLARMRAPAPDAGP